MRKMYLLLFVTLLFVGCSQNKIENDLAVMNIKGSVVAVTDTIWNVEEMFGEVVKKGIDKLIKYEFNNQGNLIAVLEYGSDGKLEEKTIKEYNEKGEILSDKTYKDDGSLYRSHVFNYINDNTHKINIVWNGYSKYTEERVVYLTNNSVDSIYSVTKEDGKELVSKTVCRKIDKYKTKVTAFQADGSILETMDYVDEKMRFIKSEGLNENLLCEWTYSDDLLISRLSRGESWYYKTDYKYKLDNKGSWIELIEYETEKDGIPRLSKMTTRNIQYK